MTGIKPSTVDRIPDVFACAITSFTIGIPTPIPTIAAIATPTIRLIRFPCARSLLPVGVNLCHHRYRYFESHTQVYLLRAGGDKTSLLGAYGVDGFGTLGAARTVVIGSGAAFVSVFGPVGPDGTALSTLGTPELPAFVGSEPGWGLEGAHVSPFGSPDGFELEEGRNADAAPVMSITSKRDKTTIRKSPTALSAAFVGKPAGTSVGATTAVAV
jgi:hypothetical protein